jgi:acyl-CoA dehydrogenase
MIPMDFALGPELEAIRQEVGKLAEAFDDAYWSDHDERHAFPWDFYNAFASQGWLGILIPERYGGAGLGVLAAGVLLRAVAASAGAMNAASALHITIWGMAPVIRHGSDRMKEQTLPATARGELHVSFGVTEDDAGTDTSRIRTFAHRDGTGYRIRGKKVWNTKAQQAQKILLLARTTPRDECRRPYDGMTLFLADLAPGFCEIREIPKLGRNAVNSNEVFIHDLPVSEEEIVGEVGRGFYQLLDGLNPERILIAAEAVGIGRRALEVAVGYARERIVFDRPIGKNQAIAHPLAESHSELEAADLLWQRAAWGYDRGEPAGGLANAAKVRAAEASFTACDRALQTFGGFGYAREFHVERYWREARLMRLAPISQEMALNYLTEHVLGLPRSY